MVNRYDNPAQAEFMNTYVPIPFEQLYKLGKEAKEDVEQAMKDYTSTLDKWGEFISPSQKDMQTYYNETVGRFAPIANEMAANPEAWKDASFRAKMYSTINNTDRAKLSGLKQSADFMRERLKINQKLMLDNRYNEEWHGIDFTNYDTTKQGIFQDVSPLGYQSIKDLTDKYVNNLKDSYLGRSGGFINIGVTGDQVRGILDANRTGILSTPEAKKHLQLYMQKTGASYEEAANAFMDKAFTDNREYIRNNVTVDPYAMQALKEQQALRLAGMRRGGNADAAGTHPDAYANVYANTSVAEKQRMKDTNYLSRTRAVIENGGNLQQQYLDAANNLQAGKITVEEFKEIAKGLENQFNQIASSEAMSNAMTEDVREMFALNANGIIPSVGVAADKKGDYYFAANRTLNQLTTPVSGQTMGKYNESQASKKVDINTGGITTEGFVLPDSKGLKLASDFVSDLMNVPVQRYEAKTRDTAGFWKTSNAINRNFGKDLLNGDFKNVVVVPRNNVMTTNINGVPEMIQTLTVKLPIASIQSAGYDVDSFKEMVGKLGITTEVGLNTKPVKDDDNGNAPFTGEFISFDVVQTVDKTSYNRLNWAQGVEKQHGSTKLQNDEYDTNFNLSVQSLFEDY